MKVRLICHAAAALCAMALGLVWAAPAAAAAGDGTPGDTNIFYAGRWDKASSAFYASNWAGAYLRTGFTGTTVRIRQRNSVEFWASIDGRAFVKFTGVSGIVNLTPTPLASGSHTLVVNYRQRAGSYNGDAVFGGLVLDPGATTVALPVRGKLIEFIGDSITAGTLSSNLALTDYGWLVGERLGTEHTQIAIGGACLVASADGCWGMEQRYFKIDAPSVTDWDFNRYRADAVVINLGTNDVGHSVTGPQFQTSYTALLRNIRAKYPAAAILALKTFRGRYIAETQNAVAAVNNSGDRNVFFVNTDGWLTADGLADAVHPNDLGHQQITNNLAPIVASRLGGGGTRRFEAEAGTCDGTIDSDHAGFSGTGFCNGSNAVGAAVQFVVTASAAGVATVGVRYANGTTTARPADVFVNGVRVQTAPFDGTGAWTTWTTRTFSAQLNAGNNTVGLSPTTANGLPNVDFLEVSTGSAPSPTPCTGPSTSPSAQPRVTVWLAGDSTVADPSGGAVCPVGWGNQFAQLFNANVTVRNSAVGGRSVQTWLYDPNVTTAMNASGECVISPTTFSTRWQAMLNPTSGMKAGDYLLIQFGINDGDRTCPRHVGSARYQELLGVMAQAAKARGARPVFLTPAAAITCSGSAAVGNRGFITETNAAAGANQVPVIDLHALSVSLYNRLGLCPNNGDFTSGAVGAFFCNDHTHFEAAGARQIAGVVATAIRNQQIPLAAYLRP